MLPDASAFPAFQIFAPISVFLLDISRIPEDVESLLELVLVLFSPILSLYNGYQLDPMLSTPTA